MIILIETIYKELLDLHLARHVLFVNHGASDGNGMIYLTRCSIVDGLCKELLFRHDILAVTGRYT